MKSIIKRPILTEKMTMLAEHQQYAFEVDINANKIEIAQAITKRFAVEIQSIRTIRYKGKRKSQFTKRGRLAGNRASWKKAIITLKPGQSIELLEA
ncbi:MAG: 50S ribosomal protein L23 [Bacteroidota bacterium]